MLSAPTKAARLMWFESLENKTEQAITRAGCGCARDLGAVSSVSCRGAALWRAGCRDCCCGGWPSGQRRSSDEGDCWASAAAGTRKQAIAARAKIMVDFSLMLGGRALSANFMRKVWRCATTPGVPARLSAG